jgi:aminobenzoyl-glutamate transport protein
MSESYLAKIERLGNRIPDPATLLLLCAITVLGVSAWGSGGGWTAIDPLSGRLVRPVNLLDAEHLPALFINMLDNFRSFPPAAIGVAVFVGVGIAQRSGFLEVSVGSLLKVVSARWLTPVVMFACVCIKVVTVEGALFLIPLAGALYAAAGRNPLVGIATAFAGLLGALCANVFIAPMDSLFFSITQIGARLVDPSWTANIAGNYYIMFAWAIILTALGTLITEYFVAPRLERANTHPAVKVPPLTSLQRRGLIAATLVLAACLALLALSAVPKNGLMRDPGGSLAPFYRGMVAFVMMIGLLTGTAYGVAAGTVKSYRDLVKFAGASVGELGSYLVICFVAAQFVAWFSASNLGTLMSIHAAQALQTAGMPVWGMLVVLILFSFTFELLLTSANVKWALMSPVVVPLLMLMHISPEAATAAFRIGDSAGGVIAPTNVLLPLVLAFARRYDPNFGLGSLLALMLPYAILFLLSGIAILLVWNGFSLPLGPDGAQIAYPH